MKRSDGRMSLNEYVTRKGLACCRQVPTGWMGRGRVRSLKRAENLPHYLSSLFRSRKFLGSLFRPALFSPGLRQEVEAGIEPDSHLGR
jgi:hypothetical protein